MVRKTYYIDSNLILLTFISYLSYSLTWRCERRTNFLINILLYIVAIFCGTADFLTRCERQSGNGVGKMAGLFRGATMTKYSISVTEMTREASQQNPRLRNHMCDLNEVRAIKKVVILMYFPLHELNGLAALCDFGSVYSSNCDNRKKVKSAKTSRDARALNESISKDKYHFRPLENVIDMMAELLTYAYGEVQLDELTRHCKF